MKILINLIFTIFLSLIITSCGTAPTGGWTPAAIVEQACPPLQSAITSLEAIPGRSAGTLNSLTTTGNDINTVCAAGATITSDTPTALASTVIPALEAVVNAAPELSSSQKASINTGLMVVQVAINFALGEIGTTAPVVSLKLQNIAVPIALAYPVK